MSSGKDIKMKTQIFDKPYSYDVDIYNYLGTTTSKITHALAGITYPMPEYEVQRKFSNAYSIEYVYEGEGVIQQDSTIYRIHAGDFFILSPNKFHHYFSAPKNPWKKIWFVVYHNCTFIDKLFDIYDISDVVLFRELNNPLRLEEILKLIKEKPFDIERRLETLVFQLAGDISDVKLNHPQPDKNPAILGKQYIDKYIFSKITIEYICTQLAISRSYFFRLFKNQFGISPNEYIINSRINIAKKYLEETSLSILEISEKLMFTDTAHFSHTFKKITEKSPSEYRNSIKNR